MSVAIVADSDSGERARCVGIIASQSPLGALGASNWQELVQVLESGCEVGLIVYHPSLPGAPDDALDVLPTRTPRLAVVTTDDEAENVPEGASRLRHPVQAETLVLLAHSAERTKDQTTFQPASLIQMLCMSGESQVLVITRDDADVGIIEIRDGELWTAFDSLGVGEAAFVRLMYPSMRARTSPGQAFTKERTLFGGYDELIIDALRLIDEGKVSIPPPLSALDHQPVREEVRKQDTDIAELVRQARQQLTQRDYNEATRTLVRLAEHDPSSQLVRANLAQLNSLGYPND